MNHWTRLPLLGAICALMLFACVGSASAATLTPTPYPLAGSNFQGGDGDQLTPTSPADVGGAIPSGGGTIASKPDGVNDIDWQAIPNAPGAADAINPDIAFAGGTKESAPRSWSFANEGVGVHPSKDTLLAAWSNSSSSVS